MTTGSPAIPDRASMTGPEWVAQAEINALVDKRTSWAFAPHAASTPNMQVFAKAGAVYYGGTLTEKALQNTSNITAPTTNPRIDRVVIDAQTGTISVITGSEAASPSPPAITAGKLPCAQVLLYVGMTEITDADITDERISIGAGSSIIIDTVYDGTSADATHDFTCPFGNPKSFSLLWFNVDFSPNDFFAAQLGYSGGIDTTHYVSREAQETGSGGGSAASSTSHILLSGNLSSAGSQGRADFSLIDAATNTWVTSGVVGPSNAIGYFHSTCQLSGTLTTVRIKGRNDSDFATGLINIQWNG